jgi:hypothetical protein
MSHDYHEGHPGFSPDQILKDGCGECSQRSKNVWMAINYLDPTAFAKAWGRATAFERGDLADVSEAEVPLLRALWAMQVQFERISGLPIGQLPIPLVVSV